MIRELRTKERTSGVEIFKIIGILLIIINHVTQTLGQPNAMVAFSDYIISLGYASKDVQLILLNLLRQAGALGNNIFFVCSAWFLVGKTKSESKKVFSILCTVWSISIIYLLLFLVLYPEPLPAGVIIKQIFPTCFSNNWYTTCYIIFLFLYPSINKLISVINQEDHLKLCIFTSALWIVVNYFKYGLFFPNELILWITIYFLIAYLKLYCPQIIKSKKTGIGLLTTGIVGYISQVVITNYVGLYLMASFSSKVLRWNVNCCPFYIMIAVGGLILSLQVKFTSSQINYISSLSLFVYLIHENQLFRTYIRPIIWQFIFEHFGYSQVVLWVLVFSGVLFSLSIVASSVYKKTIHKFVVHCSNKLHSALVVLYKKLEYRILRNKLHD